ncbi:MAG: hypothetical protein GY926_26755 [bacterium]|nr:hypothetical protein [bacterium]MCP4968815.1 hypothetical protein [bacterium]
MTVLRHVRHLVSRFFGVITSQRLGPGAQDEVNAILAPDAAKLFWEQASIDQRHSFDVAQRVRDSLGEDRAALQAALLHDVGKRHSSLGPVTRSLATVLDAAHLPMPAQWRRYRGHGPLGAADLAAIGADPLTVAFARGSVVSTEAIDQVAWDALLAADNA